MILSFRLFCGGIQSLPSYKLRKESAVFIQFVMSPVIDVIQLESKKSVKIPRGLNPADSDAHATDI